MNDRVSALLLAAGSSTRMGRSKQLLAIHDRPAALHCLAAIREGGLNAVVAVVNSAHESLVDLMRAAGVTVAFNDQPGSEMAESVRVGLGHIDAACTGVLIFLADHPLVSSGTVAALSEVHLEDPHRIIIPVHQGRRGHPTLFPREVLSGLGPGMHLRGIIQANPDRVRLVPVVDEGTVLDMDTEAQYREVIRKSGSSG